MRAPKHFRLGSGNIVTEKDFETFTDLYQGVADSQVKADVNGDIQIWVKPVGGGLPTTQLKLDLLNAINAKRLLTVGVQIMDPTYQAVALNIDLYVLNDYRASTVLDEVKVSIQDYFDNLGFAQSITLADLFKIVMAINGVSNVVFKTSSNAQFTDVTITDGKIATLGITNYTTYGGIEQWLS
jgi:hypothetical protein